ncbi:MAG: hypothetical protein R3280_05630 [Marinobacter sp.]|uniref:hypothetical protein n=1 Tax=Marinobacter sp. TaxID=50741 RepID=UPI00299DFC01|nr:hypothetical protein [Marinobacter sp.]MDX1634093.1 hypothetical protein [Marinobacter sp.]
MALRSVLVGALLVTLIAVVALGPRWLLSDRAGKVESQNVCDPTLEACVLSTADGHWQVRLEPVAGESRRLRLTVRAPEPLAGLTAILRGESMYLGEYPIRLAAADGDTTWQASFTVPVCTLDPRMLWRVYLYQGAGAGSELRASSKLVFRDPADK